MKFPLYIPISYLEATPKQIKEVCNGCGAKGGIKVPNTIWGVNIKEACQMHDWTWHEAKTLGDFIFSNIMFFWNLFAIIWNNSNWFTLFFRASRALKYFLGVMSFKGLENFWKEKKMNDDLFITIKGKLI